MRNISYMGEYRVVKCRLLRLASAIGKIHPWTNRAYITLSGGKTLLGRDDDGLNLYRLDIVDHGYRSSLFFTFAYIKWLVNQL